MTDSVHPEVPSSHAPDTRELRLQEIRRQAQSVVDTWNTPTTQDVITAVPRCSSEDGYYGLPLLKAPQWKKEVPLYFFVGGAAGASAIIASISQITGADPRLVRDARYLAAIGGAISPALLVADLGVPTRFLNMLRVFKFQSPMSVGSWTLCAFSTSAGAAAFLIAVESRRPRFGVVRVLGNASEFISAIMGAVLSSYTGVLIGATAVPVWNQNARVLPLHFAMSGLASAAAMLELRGHNAPALNALGIVTAAGESLVGASIEARKNPALAPLKRGSIGWLTRLGGFLSGPLPLVLRLLSLAGGNDRKTKLRKLAAASTVAGSLATRLAWTRAGEASAKNPVIPLALDGAHTLPHNAPIELPTKVDSGEPESRKGHTHEVHP